MKTALLAAFVASLALTACSVSTEPRPPMIGGYSTIYAYDVPPNIRSYPTTPYAGGQAYWAQDRWYYESPQGWVTFRDVPPQLRQRQYVQQAPPAAAPSYYQRGRQPGVYRGAPVQSTPSQQSVPPQSAPPAVRVR